MPQAVDAAMSSKEPSSARVEMALVRHVALQWLAIVGAVCRSVVLA